MTSHLCFFKISRKVQLFSNDRQGGYLRDIPGKFHDGLVVLKLS